MNEVPMGQTDVLSHYVQDCPTCLETSVREAKKSKDIDVSCKMKTMVWKKDEAMTSLVSTIIL